MSAIRNPATITSVGRRMMTAGGDITYTKAVLYGQDISHLTREQLESLTSIGNPLVTVPLGISDKNDNGNGTTVILEATFQNSNLKADLPYTAVGFFAKRGEDAEKLVVVGVATDGAYLAATSPDGVATDALDIKVAIAIGDSANVTAMIDPAGSVTPATLHNAITDVKSEMKTGLDTKADKSTVDSDVKSINDTLATKADKQTVTDDLATKADKTDVDAQIGTVNKSVSDLSDTVKANKDDADKALATKADKATVESDLATKANQSDLDKTNAEVAKKANSDDVKAQIDGVSKSISDVSDTVKANKDATDQALATKADKTDVAKDIDTVNKSISSMSATITANQKATDTALDTKADKTTVNQELATKANSTDVDDKLAAKADSADVTKQIKTITDLANTKADQTALDATNATVATKANSTDVDSEIAGVTKSITDVSNTVKANKDDADKALATKADKTTVEQELAVKANSSDVDKKLDEKADKSSVDAKINAIDFSKIKFRKQYLTQNGTSSDKTWNATKNSDGSYTIDIYQDDWTAYKVASLLQAITTKADQSSLDATNKTVATKANSSDVYTKKQVDDAFSSRDATIATKADKATVDAEISKIDFTPYAKTADVNKEIKTVTDLANTKVDATYSYSKAELDKKLLALSTDTSGKVGADQVASMIAGKADKTDVDQKIATVNKSVSDLSDTVSANKTATDASLATKANASDVADNVKTLQANIDTKADKATVDAEIAKIDFTPYAKSADVANELQNYTTTVDLNKLLAGKEDAGTSYSKAELDKKLLALSTDTDGKVNADQVSSMIANKVDKSDLTSDLKSINDSIATKANTTDVNTALAKKDDITDVDAKIKTVTDLANTKADASDTYNKKAVDDAFSQRDSKITNAQNTATQASQKADDNFNNLKNRINTKANSSDVYVRKDVDNAFSEVRDRIGKLEGSQTVDSPDFNNLTASGVYYITNNNGANIKNNPVTQWGVLIVSNGNGHRISQVYYPDDGNPPWYRSLDESAWRPWYQLSTRYDVGNATNAANAASNKIDTVLANSYVRKQGMNANGDCVEIKHTGIKQANGGYAFDMWSDDWTASKLNDVIKNQLPSKANTADVNNALNDKANAGDVSALQNKVNVNTPLFREISADSTWEDIFGVTNPNNVLTSLRINPGGSGQLVNDFAAGIGFGGNDTKAVITVDYGSHVARFTAGNGTAPGWSEDVAFKSDINSTNQTVSALQQTIKTLNDTLSSANATIKTLQDTITGLQTQVNNQANEIKQLQETTIKGKTFSKSQEAAAEDWEKQNSQQIAFILDN